jgi:hypothetical protein
MPIHRSCYLARRGGGLSLQLNRRVPLDAGADPQSFISFNGLIFTE